MTVDAPPPPSPEPRAVRPRRPRGLYFALAATTVAIVALVVALVVSLSGGSGSSANTHAGSNSDSPLAGKPLPAITVKRLDPLDTPVALSTLAHGRPLYLNVWSSTCGPCRAEMPAIESVYRKVHGKVAFAGVDVEDSVGAAQQFLNRYGATYQQVRDPRLQLADALGYQAIPMSIFVNADGHIVDFRIGALSHQQLVSLLQDHFGVKT